MILAKIQAYSNDVAKVIIPLNARHHWNDFMHMHVHITFESFWWRSQGYNIFTIHLNVFTYLLCTVLQFNQVSLASAHFKVRLVTTAWIFQKNYLTLELELPDQQEDEEHLTQLLGHQWCGDDSHRLRLSAARAPVDPLSQSSVMAYCKGVQRGSKGYKRADLTYFIVFQLSQIIM